MMPFGPQPVLAQVSLVGELPTSEKNFFKDALAYSLKELDDMYIDEHSCNECFE